MIPLSFLRRAAFALLTTSALSSPVFAQDRAPVKYKTNIPPSAELSYAIKAKQSGIPLDGNAHVTWVAADGKFALDMETRAMLIGKILGAKSEGTIDEYGLAPGTFTEKRFRRDATTASFNRDTKIISFSASSETYPIKGGEQDRNSAIWQLISIARAAPAKFRPDSEWTFFVVGQRDAEPWTFKVLKHEKIQTPLGELNAVHVLKEAPPDAKRQRVDIWLAPSLEWYPARLRYTDPDEDYIEQTLVNVARKSS